MVVNSPERKLEKRTSVKCTECICFTHGNMGKKQRRQKDNIHLRLILLGINNFETKEEKYRAKIIGVFNHAQFGVIRNAIKKDFFGLVYRSFLHF